MPPWPGHRPASSHRCCSSWDTPCWRWRARPSRSAGTPMPRRGAAALEPRPRALEGVSSMHSTCPERILLPLRDLHELVAAPEFDPFEAPSCGAPAGPDTTTDTHYEDILCEPGMEYLVSR